VPHEDRLHSTLALVVDKEEEEEEDILLKNHQFSNPSID
jgi:hypothetical protein